MKDEAVKVTMIVLVVFKLHEIDETVRVRMETEHDAVGMVNYRGKTKVMAGLLLSGCPSRKLNVAELVATMAALVWVTFPFELLNAVANAFTGVLSFIYKSELRLKLKANETGVSEGGMRKAVHSRYAEIGKEYSVLYPLPEGIVKVMDVAPFEGELIR